MYSKYKSKTYYFLQPTTSNVHLYLSICINKTQSCVLELASGLTGAPLLYTGPLCFTESHFSSCKCLGAVIQLPSLQGHSDSHDIMLLLLSLKQSVCCTWDVTTVMSAPRSRVLPAPLQTYHRSGLKLFPLQFISVLCAVVPHQSDFIGREILDMCVWDLWFGLECICALYHMCVTCSIYSASIALIKTMLDGG